MNVIGFRCVPEGFFCVVLSGSQSSPVEIEHNHFSFPPDMSRGQKLCWLRKQIVELLDKYDIQDAYMKRAELHLQRPNFERPEVEGVIKETVFSHIHRECIPYLKSQIKSRLSGFNRAARYFNDELEKRGLVYTNVNYREAAIVALVGLTNEG